MRLSPRKVVKYTTFLFAFMVLNVWISYTVNFWSFNNFNERGKVSQTSGRGLDGDNGGAVPLPPEQQGRYDGERKEALSFSDTGHFRQQRSAKAITPNRDTDEIKKQHSDIGERKALVALKTEKEGNNLPHDLEGINSRAQYKTKSKTNDETTLKDIFISVKTTVKYHQSRIKLLLQTWYLLAREQTYFFTDGEDRSISEVLGDHLVNTNCSTDHSRLALSCKMAVEFDFYLASRKRWFCHVDDDVYLNVPKLVELLKGHNHKEDWYLGKPSLKHPLEVVDRSNPGMKLTFWFATGGAGFCISRSLALKMAPYAGGGRFMTTAESIRLPDDCTVGYIVEHLLKQKLTVVDQFHSHLEALWLIKSHQLKEQITFSFSEYSGKQNVINVQGFSNEDDPSRLKSLHCFLFPTFRECRMLS